MLFALLKIQAVRVSCTKPSQFTDFKGTPNPGSAWLKGLIDDLKASDPPLAAMTAVLEAKDLTIDARRSKLALDRFYDSQPAVFENLEPAMVSLEILLHLFQIGVVNSKSLMNVDILKTSPVWKRAEDPKVITPFSPLVKCGLFPESVPANVDHVLVFKGETMGIFRLVFIPQEEGLPLTVEYDQNSKAWHLLDATSNTTQLVIKEFKLVGNEIELVCQPGPNTTLSQVRKEVVGAIDAAKQQEMQEAQRQADLDAKVAADLAKLAEEELLLQQQQQQVALDADLSLHADPDTVGGPGWGQDTKPGTDFTNLLFDPTQTHPVSDVFNGVEEYDDKLAQASLDAQLAALKLEDISLSSLLPNAKTHFTGGFVLQGTSIPEDALRALADEADHSNPDLLHVVKANIDRTLKVDEVSSGLRTLGRKKWSRKPGCVQHVRNQLQHSVTGTEVAKIKGVVASLLAQSKMDPPFLMVEVSVKDQEAPIQVCFRQMPDGEIGIFKVSVGRMDNASDITFESRVSHQCEDDMYQLFYISALLCSQNKPAMNKAKEINGQVFFNCNDATACPRTGGDLDLSETEPVLASAPSKVTTTVTKLVVPCVFEAPQQPEVVPTTVRVLKKSINPNPTKETTPEPKPGLATRLGRTLKRKKKKQVAPAPVVAPIQRVKLEAMKTITSSALATVLELKQAYMSHSPHIVAKTSSAGEVVLDHHEAVMNKIVRQYFTKLAESNQAFKATLDAFLSAYPGGATLDSVATEKLFHCAELFFLQSGDQGFKSEFNLAHTYHYFCSSQYPDVKSSSYFVTKVFGERRIVQTDLQDRFNYFKSRCVENTPQWNAFLDRILTPLGTVMNWDEIYSSFEIYVECAKSKEGVPGVYGTTFKIDYELIFAQTIGEYLDPSSPYLREDLIKNYTQFRNSVPNVKSFRAAITDALELCDSHYASRPTARPLYDAVSKKEVEPTALEKDTAHVKGHFMLLVGKSQTRRPDMSLFVKLPDKFFKDMPTTDKELNRRAFSIVRALKKLGVQSLSQTMCEDYLSRIVSSSDAKSMPLVLIPDKDVDVSHGHMAPGVKRREMSLLSLAYASYRLLLKGRNEVHAHHFYEFLASQFDNRKLANQDADLAVLLSDFQLFLFEKGLTEDVSTSIFSAIREACGDELVSDDAWQRIRQEAYLLSVSAVAQDPYKYPGYKEPDEDMLA